MRAVLGPPPTGQVVDEPQICDFTIQEYKSLWTDYVNGFAVREPLMPSACPLICSYGWEVISSNQILPVVLV